MSDILIANNVYRGTGLSAPDGFGREVIRFVNAKRVRISGNIFTDWQYEANAVRIGCMMYEVGAGPASPLDTSAVQPPPEDCVIEGNTFVITDVNTPIRAISVYAGKRTNVVGNTVRVNRNLVAGEFNAVVIGVQMDPQVSDTLIENNHIHFSGTVAAATDAAGVGNHPATAAACANLTVRGNTVINGARGLFFRTTSDDLVVVDNETSTCAGADSIPNTAHGSIGGGSVQLFNAKPGPNYEKLMARFSSNVAEIGTVFGGTGTARSVRLGVAASAQASPNTSGLSRFLQLNPTLPFAQFLTSTSATGSMVQVGTTTGGAFNASSGNQTILAVSPTMNQSSTAGYTMLLVNPTETATGSGTKRLIDAQVGGSTRFNVDNSGNVFTNGTLDLGNASDTTIARASAGVVTIEGNTVSTRLTNTATLDFPSVSAQSQASLTMTVTGAVTGDAVALGVPTAAVTNGIDYTAWVSAADTVTVRAANYSAGPLDPASGTFRATIIR
jgi:hypothetical protein